MATKRQKRAWVARVKYCAGRRRVRREAWARVRADSEGLRVRADNGESQVRVDQE